MYGLKCLPGLLACAVCNNVSCNINIYFSLQNDQQRIVKPICFTILWLILAGHAPTFFVSCVNHPFNVMFIFIIFNESTKPLCRIHKAIFSRLIHLSPHPSQFLLSVFFIYSSKAHLKFSEHCSQIPAFVRLWRLPVQAAGLGADSWLFSLSLFRSACLSMTSPSVVHHEGENEREASVCSSTGVPGRQCWSTWKHYSKSHDWSLGQIPFHLREGSRVATKVSRFGCMFLLP